MRKILVSLIFTVAIGGCATPPASKVDLGMKRDEVRAILGKPHRVNVYGCNAHGNRENILNPCNEYWTYNGFSSSSKIHFTDGVVVGW